jgi:small nuclear ribonucleoprotein (snRNP)-like protein
MPMQIAEIALLEFASCPSFVVFGRACFFAGNRREKGAHSPRFRRRRPEVQQDIEGFRGELTSFDETPRLVLEQVGEVRSGLGGFGQPAALGVDPSGFTVERFGLIGVQ